MTLNYFLQQCMKCLDCQQADDGPLAYWSKLAIGIILPNMLEDLLETITKLEKDLGIRNTLGFKDPSAIYTYVKKLNINWKKMCSTWSANISQTLTMCKLTSKHS